MDEVLLKSAGDVFATYAGRGRDLAPWLVDAEINRERQFAIAVSGGTGGEHRSAGSRIFQAILNYRRYPADLFVASADIEAQLRSWYDER